MEQSPSSEAGSRSASQEILRLLWSPKVHCDVHKSLRPVPILSQINATPHLPILFPKDSLKYYLSIYS
jgi:hypothetical protein